MHSYILSDIRLAYRIESAARRWAADRLGLEYEWKAYNMPIERGARAVVKHTLKRLIDNKDLPMKATKAQSGYGITDADLPELQTLVFEIIDEHLQKIGAEFLELTDIYSPTAAEQMIGSLTPTA